MTELKLEAGWLRRDVVEAVQQTGNWQSLKSFHNGQDSNKITSSNQNQNKPDKYIAPK